MFDSPFRRKLSEGALALVLFSSLALKLRHLGHRALNFWDESFHAVVAKNLLKHPLKFTLYDQPWLPYKYTSWTTNHIWLHKPPLALWQIALSYMILGTDALALRLPSALLSTGSVLLTYLIAKELFDKPTGVIAAFWQAFNSCTFWLVQGYMYGDHIDVALLFWIEVSCYFLIKAVKTGRVKFLLISGFAQGLAYLTKSYLGFIAFGILLVLWLLKRFRFLEEKSCRLRLRDLVIHMATTAVVVAPWVIYCLLRFPREFLHEHKLVFNHFHADIESMGATWDRHIFDYMVTMYPWIYTLILPAAVVVLAVALRKKGLGETVIAIWGLGIIVPLSLARSKPLFATLIAMPPLLIALAVLVRRGIRNSHLAYSLVWVLSLAVLVVHWRGQTNVWSRDVFDGSTAFAPYLQANSWILVRLLIAGALFVPLYFVLKKISKPEPLRLGIRAVAVAATLFFSYQYMTSAKAVTNFNRDDAKYKALGRRIGQELPPTACLFLEEPNYDYGQHVNLMFYSGRSTYPRLKRNLQSAARQVKNAGGIPFLVTQKKYAFPAVFKHRQTGYRIYRLE